MGQCPPPNMTFPTLVLADCTGIWEIINEVCCCNLSKIFSWETFIPTIDIPLMAFPPKNPRSVHDYACYNYAYNSLTSRVILLNVWPLILYLSIMQCMDVGSN